MNGVHYQLYSAKKRVLSTLKRPTLLVFVFKLPTSVPYCPLRRPVLATDTTCSIHTFLKVKKVVHKSVISAIRKQALVIDPP